MRLLLLSLAVLLCPNLLQAQELRLVPMGSITSFDPVKGRQDVTTFKLVVGDPGPQEQLALARAQWGSIAAQNAAFYIPNPDGSWRLQNYSLPPGDDKPFTDPQVLLGHQKYRDYLFAHRAELEAFLKDPDAFPDFGQPGDYFYKRSKLSSAELPAPFNRLSAEALGSIEAIERFNEGGAMKIYLKEPLDRDGSAQQVLARMQAELN